MPERLRIHQFMKRMFLILLLISVAYHSEAFCNPINDSAFSNRMKVSVPTNIAQSLLLPSYASHKSENYILSSFQACLDLLPFYIMATQDLRGEGGMAILSFPIFWGINRLSAIPLNGISAFVHNYRIDKNIPVRYLPSFSDKAFFGLIVAFGSDNSIPSDNAGVFPGVELKISNFRMTAFIPSTVVSGDEYSSIYENNGDLINVKYKVKNHAIAVFDYRIRIQKSMCINPGFTIDLFESNYSYSRFIPSNGELPPACIPLRSFEKTAYFICPKISWEITRFSRFTFEHSISFPLVVEHNLKSYYRKTDKVMKKMFYMFSMNALLF